MKIPKTVFICGANWKVILNKKSRGGYYKPDVKTISIGIKDYEEQEIFIIFLHEVTEAILSERMLRYKRPYISSENGDYLFVLNHLQFENAIRDLALALKDI